MRGVQNIGLATAITIGIALAIPTAARSAQVPSLDAVRLLLDQGHYAEAEQQAEALFDAISANSDQQDASDLLVEALTRNGRGGQARTLELAQQVLRARSAAHGPDSPLAATSLRNLGDVLFQSGEYRNAIVQYRSAVAIPESGDRKAIEIAEDLDRLARALNEVEQYDEAVGHVNRALAIREADGAPGSGVARTLLVRGLVYLSKGDYPRARADLERALALQEAAHPLHPETALVLAGFGEELVREGSLAEARQVLERAVTLSEHTLRPDHPEVAAVLRLLGDTLQEFGDFAGARAVRERALSVAERAYGADHPKLAIQLNDMANALFLEGEYSTARTLYERAHSIYEKRLGPDDNGATTASFNLALLYMRIGDFQEARRRLLAVIDTWERVNGREHPTVARALAALGDALAEQRLDSEALPYYERALAIREKTLGPQHPNVARMHSQLSASLARLGNVDRALAHSTRALRIYERSGAQPGLAEGLVNHAQILAEAGDLVGAGSAYQRALDISVAVWGPSHPMVAETEIALATVESQQGRGEAALVRALHAEALGRGHLQLTAGYLPERQVLDYAAKRPSGLNLGLSLLLPNTQAATSVLNALILGRAVTLDEIGSRQRSFADSPELKPLWSDLVSARQRLANLVIQGRGRLKQEQFAALVAAAQGEKERAERSLAERSAAFRTGQRRAEIDIDRVRSALPPASALISFVRFDRTIIRPASPEGGRSRVTSRASATVPSYLAFVLRAGAADPVVIPLGAGNEIDGVITRWRREMVDGSARFAPHSAEAEASLRTVGTALRQKLWDPISAHLGGVRRVFVVPDAAINLVPFAALPVGRSRYLLEDGPVIHYLSAERDVVERERLTATGRGLLAVGSPSFADRSLFASLAGPMSARRSEARTTPQQQSAKTASPALQVSASSFRSTLSTCTSFQSMQFPPLPGSGREAHDVSALWQHFDTDASAQTLVGSEATERAVKALGPGKRILHLATHGFFLGSECASALDGTRAVGGLVPSGSRKPQNDGATRPGKAENPLLLSGLVLAGANHRTAAAPEEDDGILTSEEVASLDLEGLEWAVLSACNTGLGEIRAGEGVFGLRRAFQIAGARTVIMSLWSVDDEATRLWMRALYDGRLKSNLDTADAMHEAGLSVLRARRAAGQSTDPFFWAAFVAAGDWR